MSKRVVVKHNPRRYDLWLSACGIAALLCVLFAVLTVELLPVIGPVQTVSAKVEQVAVNEVNTYYYDITLGSRSGGPQVVTFDVGMGSLPKCLVRGAHIAFKISWVGNPFWDFFRPRPYLIWDLKC